MGFLWFISLLNIISFEYLISILENLAKVTGKSHNRLLVFLNKQLDKFFGTAEEQIKVEPKTDLIPTLEDAAEPEDQK
jgi:hypothetical protein